MEILEHVERHIAAGLEARLADQFHLDAILATRAWTDLSLVWPKFAVWLLVDPTHGVANQADQASAKYLAIHRVADLYREITDWDKRPLAAFRKAAWFSAGDPTAAYAADAAAVNRTVRFWGANAAEAAGYAVTSSPAPAWAKARKLIELLRAAPVPSIAQRLENAVPSF